MPDITNDGFFSLLPRLNPQIEKKDITKEQRTLIQKSLDQFYREQPYVGISIPYSKTAFIHSLSGKRLAIEKYQQILLMLLADEGFLFGKDRSSVRNYYLNLPFARAAKKSGRSKETASSDILHPAYDAIDWEKYQRYRRSLDSLTRLCVNMRQESEMDTCSFSKALSAYPKQIGWDTKLHEKTDVCFNLLRRYHSRTKIIGINGKEENAVWDCKVAISNAIKTAYEDMFEGYSVLLLWLLFDKHSSCLLRGKNFPNKLNWPEDLDMKSIHMLEELTIIFRESREQLTKCTRIKDIILFLKSSSLTYLRTSSCLAFWSAVIEHSYSCLRFNPKQISFYVPQRPEERIFLNFYSDFDTHRENLAKQLRENTRAITAYRRVWENRYKNNNEIVDVIKKISPRYEKYFRIIEPSLAVYCSPDFIDRTSFLPPKMLLDELKMNILEAALQTVVLEQTRKELIEQAIIAFG